MDKLTLNQRFALVGSALLGACLLIAFTPELANAQSFAPAVTINTSSNQDISNGEVYSGLKLIMLLGILTLLPSVLMTVTCFTRISIVLGLTRQALGTAQTPPNQVILGLALFLTFAIMGPVFDKMHKEALIPFTEDQITMQEALDKAYKPLQGFMLRHTREQDLELFLNITKTEKPDNPEDLGPTVVVPAFVISELNSAFQIAFLIYLPFLILDMIISSVLTSMSMITLPPTVISLPIKLMLFVMIDGWHLIIGNVVQSYHV